MDKMPKAEPMKQETDDQDISWRDVSYVIDRILILTFTLVLIVITGVFMSILSNGKQ